ncbi:MAG: tRNA 4-thiouridine(8) synthase ThiI [Myxococcales bacterium]|nr:tRNA 4-thiouridine(8) synthase ThiI [Myxococcales bacterium]
MNASDNLIVLAVGEIFLKRGNRRRFFAQLRKNAARAVRDLELDVSEIHGRLVVHHREARLDDPAAENPPIPIEAALRRLQWVFGVHSAMPGCQVPSDLRAIEEIAAEYLARRIGSKPLRFRVDTRRPNKSFPMRSVDVNREVGIAMFDRFPNLVLDLHEPELTLHIELGQALSFIYRRRHPMGGGLPVGSSGKVLLLLSGGLDSPVAGYLAQKRGCQVEALYFHSFPYISDHAKEKVKELAALLARGQGAIRLNVAPFTAIQEAIRDKAPNRQYVLLYRRFMLRIAEALAERVEALALVTGEAISQVASQTLQNMRCIEAVTRLPIIRPLVTYDKLEVVDLSRRLEMFEISTRPHDDCCSLFVARHPETKGRVEFLEQIEEGLDVEGLVADALDRIEVFEFR